MKKINVFLLSLLLTTTTYASQLVSRGIEDNAVTNAKIDSSAAISLSKLSTVTASRALQSDASGFVSASGVTSTTLAFLDATSSIQTQLNAKQASGNYITALTGDATASGPGSAAITFATVNSNVGSFGSSTSIPSLTVNAKGLVTAASGNVVIAPAGTLSGTTLNSTVVSSSLTSVGTIATGVWNGTTIAIANGGTGQTTKAAAFDALSPMTTGGDIIYGGASGTGTRLANGTSGQVLTSAGGTAAPSWTTVVTSSSTISTKTANYTIASGDGTIIADATSGGFTLTLPSASGVTGQVFTIKRKDSVVANQVTISGTIDGATDWKLYTQNETLVIQSDGSVYFQVQHDTNTGWVDAGTISITGTTTNPTKGTTSQDKSWWRRVGANMEVRLEYRQTAGGTAGSGDYKYAIPNSSTFSIDTTQVVAITTVSLTNVTGAYTVGIGMAVSSGSTTGTGNIIVYDSTNVRLLAYNGSTLGCIGSAFFQLSTAGISHSLTYSVPITGWKP